MKEWIEIMVALMIGAYCVFVGLKWKQLNMQTRLFVVIGSSGVIIAFVDALM